MSAHHIKPRGQYDSEDWLDFLDGWHEVSSETFHTKRNPERIIRWREGVGPMSAFQGYSRTTIEEGQRQRRNLDQVA